MTAARIFTAFQSQTLQFLSDDPGLTARDLAVLHWDGDPDKLPGRWKRIYRHLRELQSLGYVRGNGEGDKRRWFVREPQAQAVTP